MKTLIPLFLCIAASVAFADILPPDSHSLDLCVKIANLVEFPDVTIVGLIQGPMSSESGYRLSEVAGGTCLGKGYKFNSLSLYAVKKNGLGPSGVQSLGVKTTTKPNEGCIDENGQTCTYKAYSIDDSRAQLLSDAIETYGGYISNSDQRSSVSVNYYLAEGQNGKISLVKGETTTKYTDGREIRSGERPASAKTPFPPIPSPPPSPNSVQKDFFSSFICFFVQLFGGRC